MTPKIDRDRFVAIFEQYFDLEAGSVGVSDAMVEDLGFDSIMMYEVLLMLEELRDEPVDDATLADIVDVGDIFFLYCQGG